MKNRWLIVFALGSVAALTVAVILVLLAPSIPSRLREGGWIEEDPATQRELLEAKKRAKVLELLKQRDELRQKVNKRREEIRKEAEEASTR
jgi:hypothetical protein